MTKFSTQSMKLLQNMRAKNISYKTINMHLKVNRTNFTDATKQIKSFEFKVKKSGSG